MLRHVVLLKWSRELEAGELEEIGRLLDTLASSAPSIRCFSHGPDIGLSPRKGDYAVIADFDDREGWQDYDTHPAHLAVRGVLKPVTAENLVVQFDVASATTSPDRRELEMKLADSA
jgi:Stress responsive A/B Barrel Domain